jgi:tellurite resistance protein TerC
VFRGIFIAVGAAAINQFSWIFYLFGAFLVYTAIHLAMQGENDDEDFKENAVIRFAKKRLNATDEYNGVKLTVLKNGKRLVTPMAIVIIALGTTDLLFALDSIPAIFGITQEPYLVFTANVFALMGLRQLYFLLGGLLDRLVYLNLGLAVVLAFIGVKLVLEALADNNLPFINGGEHLEGVPDIGIVVSLSVIIGALAITTIASLIHTRKKQRKEAAEAANGNGNGNGVAAPAGEAPKDAEAKSETPEPSERPTQ